MARARADGEKTGVYGIVELFYGIEITDALLRRRGLKKTRVEYVRSAFYRGLTTGAVYTALVDLLLYLTSLPLQLMIVMSPILVFEGFSLYLIMDAFRFFLPFKGVTGPALVRRIMRSRRELRGRAGKVERVKKPRLHPAALASALMGSYAHKLTMVFSPEDVKRLIEAADVGIPVEYYYSLMLAVAMMTGATTTIVSSLIVVYMAGLPPWTIAVIAPLGFVIGFAVGLVGAFTYLSFKADSRKRKLEQDLSTWIAAMMAYMSSGVPLADALRRSAGALKPGPLRRDIEKTIRDMELLGMDARTSLTEMASRTPSPLVREVISGLIDAIDSGEDLQGYFKEIFNYVLNVRRAYMKKLIGDFTFAAELFVLLFVVTPLFMAIILALLGSASSIAIAQLSYGQLLAVLAYLFIPIVGIGYMVLIDSIYPRWW